MAVPGLVVVGANATLDVIATGGAQAGQIVYAYTDPATTSYFKGAATIANGVIYVGDWNGHLDAFGI
jgi:outer membrane protein assembly factor BamB